MFAETINRLSQLGGKCTIGNPITPGYTDEHGLRYQWFQRVLLHEMPAYIDRGLTDLVNRAPIAAALDAESRARTGGGPADPSARRQ